MNFFRVEVHNEHIQNIIINDYDHDIKCKNFIVI